MLINELLLEEFDEEVKKTRPNLERVQADKRDFAPHPRSMPFGKLASHVAQLPEFGLMILTTPQVDFATAKFTTVPLESGAQLVKAFDDSAAKTRSALAGIKEEAWAEPWKLIMQGKPLFEGSRFLAYRQMFLNHVVHHRAQLGVYLRMTDEKIPAIYGPSADDTLGF